MTCSTAVSTKKNAEPAYRNVGDAERLLAGLGGCLLTAYGLSRQESRMPWLAAGAGLLYRGISGHCPVYGVLGISSAAPHAPAASIAAGRGVRVEASVFIQAPPQEVYTFWRDLRNLPRFMERIQDVVPHGNLSHWTAQGSFGATLEWKAQIIKDRRNELIAWRSLPGAALANAGSVHFDDCSDGTQVTVVMKYDMPAGWLGDVAAQWLGYDPAEQLRVDLDRLRDLLEEEAKAPTAEFRANSQTVGRRRLAEKPGQSAQEVP